MTKKDYIRFAEMLRRADMSRCQCSGCGDAGESVITDVLNGMIDIFASDNPNFDRARFEAAVRRPRGAKA